MKYLGYIILTLILTGVLYIKGTDHMISKSYIRGKVYWDIDDSPLWTKDLRLKLTDGDGEKVSESSVEKNRFFFSDIPNGEYTLEVFKEGEVILERLVEKEKKAMEYGTILLKADPYSKEYSRKLRLAISYYESLLWIVTLTMISLGLGITNKDIRKVAFLVVLRFNIRWVYLFTGSGYENFMTSLYIIYDTMLFLYIFERIVSIFKSRKLSRIYYVIMFLWSGLNAGSIVFLLRNRNIAESSYFHFLKASYNLSAFYLNLFFVLLGVVIFGGYLLVGKRLEKSVENVEVFKTTLIQLGIYIFVWMADLDMSEHSQFLIILLYIFNIISLDERKKHRSAIKFYRRVFFLCMVFFTYEHMTEVEKTDLYMLGGLLLFTLGNYGKDLWENRVMGIREGLFNKLIMTRSLERIREDMVKIPYIKSAEYRDGALTGTHDLLIEREGRRIGVSFKGAFKIIPIKKEVESLRKFLEKVLYYHSVLNKLSEVPKEGEKKYEELYRRELKRRILLEKKLKGGGGQ